eukprot:jgi/Tetstr1/433127/TSEL_022459.t1
MAVSVFALRSPSASGSSWPEAMTNRRVARLRHGAQTRAAPPAPQTTVYPRRAGGLVVCQAAKKRGGTTPKSKATGGKGLAAASAASGGTATVSARPRGGSFSVDDLDEGVTLANSVSPLGGGLAVEEGPDGRCRLRTLQRCRTLVLDCSYRPIDVVNWQRAICLDLLEKADVLEYYSEQVRCSRESYPVPAVVRVRFFLNKKSDSQLPCVRRYILIRDDYSCQYCGSSRNLSMDHVHPVSLGGSWSWENLVTCCTSCNCRKGSKTLKELGWKLRRQPKAPSPFQMEVVNNMTATDIRAPPAEWLDYLPEDHRARLYPSR